MANPNSEIWGASSTWIYSKKQAGLETTAAKSGNFDKPKTAYFGTGGISGYEGSLYRAINTSQKLVANEFLDESICPCGQEARVSPWGKIAIFNKANNGSVVPEIQDFTDKNINWFFADKAESRPVFYQQIIKTGSAFMPYEQYAPNADTSINADNIPLTLCPYVSWGLKSLLLSIEVGITLNDANPISGSLLWVTLDDWKNNYSTSHYMTGLRFFVRSCTAINNTTLALTYQNDGALPSGNGCSGLICPMNKIIVKNGGEFIPTQFLYFMGFASSTRRAHIFTPTGQISVDSSTANTPWLGVLPCWDYFQNQTIQVYHPYSDTYYYYYKIPYSDDTYNKIMSIAALFGCFFTPTNKYVFDYDMLDNDLYLPIIDENGVAHGRYTRGAENANNPLYTKNSIRDIDYDPTAPPTPTDPNTYSVTTGFNTVGNVASTTKAYVVNAAALTGLSGEMWNIINNLVTSPDDMTKLDNLTLDAFLTNNPIDAIVSVKKFPLSSVPHAENLENIYLGKYQTGAAGYALAMQQARYNFEGIPIFPKFGNCFLDYGPYTKMQLYVPFCGTIDIDAADFMGRTLSVEMVIDFITGSVTAYVLSNQLVVTSLTGTCAIDIPITGTEQSTVSASLENAIIQEKSARGSYTLKGSVGGMLTNPIGNITHPSSALENRFNTKLQTMQANYNLQHVEMPLRQIGNASPLNSWALEFVCRLIIYYPDGECITFNATNEPSLITDKVESFGAVNGFATVETNTLSSFTGFTQVSDADLSGVSATDTEKEMILSLLQSGVYL